MQAGHQRIGLVIPSVHDRLIRYSISSGFTGIHADTHPGRVAPIFDYNRPHGRPYPTPAELAKWIGKQRLDGLISLHVYIQLIGALPKQGIRIPQDLGFACCRLPADQAGKVAGVLMDEEGTGVALAQQLLFAIQHGIFGAPEHSSLTLIRGHWQDGPTMRSRNKSNNTPAETR
jgi:hypothetical protein